MFFLQVMVKVSLGDPGYIYTAKILVAAAISLLKDRESIQQQMPGGVFTVGTLLRHTGYRERLQSQGIRFEVLNQSKK